MSGAEFRSQLDTEVYDEQKGIDKLLGALAYFSAVLGKLIEVPAGFLTDYASVPRLPLAYAVLGGKGKKAAVVHDWLYKSQSVPRAVADAVFREALEASGYGPVVRAMFYAGVRVGGWVAWRQHARENTTIAQPPHVVAAMDAAATPDPGA